MGIVDAIKNALFEVEYVEVNNDDKKSHKEKRNNDKEKNKDENIDKPIAKKIILPNHKRDRNKDIKTDIQDNTIEKDSNSISIENDNLNQENQIPNFDDLNNNLEENRNDFKVMSDNDFKVEEYPPRVEKDNYDNDYYNDTVPKESYEDSIKKSEDNRVLYRNEYREKAPYGIDDSIKPVIHDYGKAYEKKEDRSGFKPSPIISPIYGVLDKNYKKEDVREKREVKISSYTSENFTVDDVRNKAYGPAEEKIEDRKRNLESSKAVVEEEEEDDDTNLLVDLSKEDGKPAVKEITMGDALEYFQDLGLEYNVDYVDASKEKAAGRRVKQNYDEEPELFAIEDLDSKEKESEDEKKETSKESNQKNDESIDVENDDNLFDLIDSMYVEK